MQLKSLLLQMHCRTLDLLLLWFRVDHHKCLCLDRTAVVPHSIRDNPPTTSLKVDLSFPPAAPTDTNIQSLCHNQKLRPIYNTKCLAGLGYDLVAHQAKTTNHLEKRFKQCCKNKKNTLPCAQKSVNYFSNSYLLYHISIMHIIYLSVYNILCTFVWV